MFLNLQVFMSWKLTSRDQSWRCRFDIEFNDIPNTFVKILEKNDPPVKDESDQLVAILFILKEKSVDYRQVDSHVHRFKGSS